MLEHHGQGVKPRLAHIGNDQKHHLQNRIVYQLRARTLDPFNHVQVQPEGQRR